MTNDKHIASRLILRFVLTIFISVGALSAEVMVIELKIKSGPDGTLEYTVGGNAPMNLDQCCVFLSRAENRRDSIWLTISSPDDLDISVLLSLLRAVEDNKNNVVVRRIDVGRGLPGKLQTTPSETKVDPQKSAHPPTSHGR